MIPARSPTPDLSPGLEDALRRAFELAMSLRQPRVAVAHFLVAALDDPRVASRLRDAGAEPRYLSQIASDMVVELERRKGRSGPVVPRRSDALRWALEAAVRATEAGCEVSAVSVVAELMTNPAIADRLAECHVNRLDLECLKPKQER